VFEEKNSDHLPDEGWSPSTARSHLRLDSPAAYQGSHAQTISFLAISRH